MLESLQDEQKRQENLAQLRLGFDELSQIWVDKGQVTEQEARKFVDGLMAQSNPACSSPSGRSSSEGTAEPATAQAQAELEELTRQLAEIRTDLENERKNHP